MPIAIPISLSQHFPLNPCQFHVSNQERYRSRSRSPGREYNSLRSRVDIPYRSRSPRRGYSSSSQTMSQQDRRVYVGNLSYEVKWHHLKDFMRQAGNVLYADVLQLANGRSKGCGIVEYATQEEAQKAVETLSNQELMGRLVYVREDRETDLKYAAGRTGNTGGSGNFNGPAPAAGTQLFVSNLPYSVGWQDLKDLFRSAGNIVRADVQQTPDGRSKGSGIVLFENAEDAQSAIEKYNGYDWNGRTIEVREDKFAGSAPPSRSTFGARGGGSFRGGFRGGRGGSYGSFNGGSEPRPPNDFTDGATGNGDSSETIYVGNLPWSTTNQDLIDLFQTVGEVDRAEIQYLPNGRSQGAGVVRFTAPSTAEIAISKFNGYNYGNRDLALSFVSYGETA
jgi:RNA recognition motif-containing protein